jgi:Peptidase S46
MRVTLISTTALILSLASYTPAVMADEGMWMPHQTKAIGQRMVEAGLKLDPAKLGDFNAAPLNAIVSLGGCSASFLSDQGLVATNHHCVYGSIQYNSKPGTDYLKDGFLAKTLADELPAAPGTRIFVIEDLRDVTTEMNLGLAKAKTGTERFNLMDINRKNLISACEKQANRRCDVRAYFGGASYFLQQQLEIKDVRLVYAPAGGIGNFGGETDNWMWPRHTGDWGFYRAYVAPDGASAAYSKENVPFKPKAHLKIASEGVKEGDFIMVAGFPGTTTRLVTASEARFAFEKSTPLTQKLLADYSDLIAKVTLGDADATIKYASIIRGSDNYKKKTLGEMAGSEAIDLSGKKQASETAYRAWVKADPQRFKAYGPSIEALETLISEEQATQIDSLRTSLINRAQLLSSARTAYRFAKERQKPDELRDSGFQERDRRTLTERLTAVERRFVPKVDRAILEQALTEYRSVSEKSQDKAFLAKLDEIGLDKLYADTKLSDTATRIAWLDKSPAEFEASEDPFIKLAVALYPADDARNLASKERAGKTQAVRATYMKGLLAYEASQGRSPYPDANGSLRFTYGHIKGRVNDGQIWTPFTTAEGLVAKQRGKGEFDAPAKLITQMKAKNWGPYASKDLGTLPINYLSTVDITNGNSGSATLNAKGEFVGLAFDGTLDGVVSDWYFEAPIIRTIHADSRYMLWTMQNIDGANRLLTEMGVNP